MTPHPAQDHSPQQGTQLTGGTCSGLTGHSKSPHVATRTVSQVTCQNPMQRQSDVGQVCVEKEVSVGTVQLQPGPDQGAARAGQGPGAQVGGIVQLGWSGEDRVGVVTNWGAAG